MTVDEGTVWSIC